MYITSLRRVINVFTTIDQVSFILRSLSASSNSEIKLINIEDVVDAACKIHNQLNVSTLTVIDKAILTSSGDRNTFTELSADLMRIRFQVSSIVTHAERLIALEKPSHSDIESFKNNCLVHTTCAERIYRKYVVPQDEDLDDTNEDDILTQFEES